MPVKDDITRYSERILKIAYEMTDKMRVNEDTQGNRWDDSGDGRT